MTSANMISPRIRLKYIRYRKCFVRTSLECGENISKYQIHSKSPPEATHLDELDKTKTDRQQCEVGLRRSRRAHCSFQGLLIGIWARYGGIFLSASTATTFQATAYAVNLYIVQYILRSLALSHARQRRHLVCFRTKTFSA